MFQQIFSLLITCINIFHLNGIICNCIILFDILGYYRLFCFVSNPTQARSYKPDKDYRTAKSNAYGKTIVAGVIEVLLYLFYTLSAQIAPPAGIPASSTVPEETMSVTPKPEFTTPTDRMWNITRLSFDRMDRNNLLYRHDFQRHFIVGRGNLVITLIT